ncbi:hypothetical protein M408DRAFT_234874 [Serendipita vermifera MAFF 305830]|uniref:WDR59/RTC1-like RING zinc finger domain-containing protein n=1 Tax=Serendipita vermifera MAFF 305830 TaxID=933852 RepID=A0A0C2X4R5_SERVB|nr:hypothetical protein M408DRAFT_234874 [Serendipita vermifera MAFF 305830]
MIPTPPETASPEEVETPPAASTPPPQRSLTAKAGGAFGGVLYPFFFPGTSDGNEQPRKNRGSDPPTPVSNDVPGSIPVPQRGSFFRSNARSPRQHRGKSDASVPTLGSIPGPSTSSGTGSFGRLNLPGKSKKPGSTFVPTPGTINKITVTFALRGKPKARLTSSIPQDRWRREDHKMPVPSIKFHKKTDLYSSGKRFTMPEALRVQYITHIHVYAELLFRIGLVAARAEVLDITGCPPLESELNSLERDHLIIRSVCRDCGELHDDLREMRDICPTHFIRRPECTFCRLPVRGLSRTCLKCKHTTHLKCWDQHQRSSDQTKSITCASGCGCECPTNASFNALGAPVQPTQKPASPVAFRQWAL